MSGSEQDGPASHKPGHGSHDEEHEEHENHEAWVIPYADMLTLLMALFLMLWATSSLDEKKFASLANSLRDALGEGTGESPPGIIQGSAGVLTGQETGVQDGDFDKAESQDVMTAQRDAAREQKEAEEKMRENAVLNGVQQRITARAQAEGVLDSIKFRRESRGLVVSIIADPVLFDVGSADLKPQGQQILRVVTDALKGVPNEVLVEGHTDNTPINTPRYPSNWELSSNRGTSVLRHMVEGLGFEPTRIASTGYGETRPIVPNDNAGNRAVNRRVEVVVLGGGPD